MAARNEVAIDVLARNQATRELDAASNSLLQLGNSAQQSSFAARTASGIWQGAMISIGNSINQFVMQGVALVSDAIIGFNARTEQALIGFTTMLGSAQKAQGFLEELQAFAAATPFEFDGLRQSANLIMAMGFEARDVIPLLTAAGDAVAALGLGSEAVQRVVYALGQMKSAGRVTGQDMMQLASMGIPAWQMLADAVGMTVMEAKKAAEQGLIDAETAIEGITTAIEEGDMGGMMQAQARTFNGAISTVKDTIAIVVSGAFKPLFDTVSAATIGLADFLGSADFLAWANDAGEAINDVIVQFVGLGEAIIPIAMEVLPAVGEAFVSVGDIAMRTLNAVVPLLESIVSAVAALGPVFSVVVGPLTTFAVTLGAVNLAVGLFTRAIGGLVAMMMGGTAGGIVGMIGKFAGFLIGLPALLAGATTATYTWAGAVTFLTGGLNLIIPILVTLLTLFVDVGDLVDSVAMQFGDMGETVARTARNLNAGESQVRATISTLRDLGLSFEEANYVMNRLGDDAEGLADDVVGAMDRLGLGVEEATSIVEALGSNWEISFDAIDRASEESHVGWQTVFDDLTKLYGGMLSTAEIIDIMNEAAAESPEAFARLASELTESEQAAVDLAEQFNLTSDAIEEANLSWVRSVKEGKDEIVVTLTDGTRIVGDTMNDIMGQVEQVTKDRLDAAQQAVSDMLDGVANLFNTADEARQAITDFADFMSTSMTDVQQIQLILRRTLMDDLPTAWRDGKTANDDEAAEFVNSTLEQFNTLRPGLIAKGRDGGTGLLQGMQEYGPDIIAWARDQFAPELAEGMTLAEALRAHGMDGIAAYVEGIESGEEDARRAARQVARESREAAEAEAGGYKTAGSDGGHNYGEGVRAPTNLDYTRQGGVLLGEAGVDGTESGSTGMWGGGNSAGRAWANGLRDASDYARLMAWELAAATDPALHGLSPPKEGPLSDIDISGYNIGVAWADGLRSSRGYVAMAAGEVAGAMSGGLVASGGGSVGGFDMPSLLPIEPGGTGAGPNITVNLNSTFPPTPAQGRAVAQAIIPELQRELRNQGLAR